MANIYGYVLATYGTKSHGNISQCEAVRRQINNLQHFSKSHGAALRIAYDYQRKVRCLDDLPNLRQILEQRSRNKSGIILVDCLTWLFQRPEPNLRQTFASELVAHGKHIYGVRDRCRLDDLTEDQIRARLNMNLPLLRLGTRAKDLAPKGATQTFEAMKASKTARVEESLNLALKLLSIKSELEAAGLPARGEDIAKVANDRGYRTQLGTLWSQSSVSRALKRLKGAGQ